jgi:mannose-6-phosphate isomerase-like protein (cupin superfamily)
MKYTRIFTDSAGQSHFEDIEVELTEINFAPPAPPLNLSLFNPAQQYGFCSFPVGWRGDWHPTPFRQFFFFLSGEVAVQVGDGRVRHFGPGSAVLVEDTTGKGHVSWVKTKIDALAAVVKLPE